MKSMITRMKRFGSSWESIRAETLNLSRSRSWPTWSTLLRWQDLTSRTSGVHKPQRTVSEIGQLRAGMIQTCSSSIRMRNVFIYLVWSISSRGFSRLSCSTMTSKNLTAKPWAILDTTWISFTMKKLSSIWVLAYVVELLGNTLILWLLWIFHLGVMV